MYAHKIKSGDNVNLKDFATDDNGKLTKEIGIATMEKIGEELSEMQDLLFEARTHSLLIVLQGRDTSGKDGTIRCLARYMNMQGCRVASFKVPTEEEMSHDFLWRIHSEAPRQGECAIFNRSHYEDVLAVRVHELVPDEIWKGRFEDINHFEQILHDANTIIVKFLLHVSKEEQEERLLDREKDEEKSWKLNVGDWKEREFWDSYTEAYEDVLDKCSCDWAPWYVVPADHKWFRNLAVVQTIAQTLKPYKKEWQKKLENVGKKMEAELLEYRKLKGIKG